MAPKKSVGTQTPVKSKRSRRPIDDLIKECQGRIDRAQSVLDKHVLRMENLLYRKEHGGKRTVVNEQAIIRKMLGNMDDDMLIDYATDLGATVYDGDRGKTLESVVHFMTVNGTEDALKPLEDPEPTVQGVDF